MLNAWNKIKELINKKQNILNITTGTEYETGRIIDGKKAVIQAIKKIFAASPLNLLREADDYGGNARVLIFEMTG